MPTRSKEKDIQDFLAQNPYLVAPHFRDAVVKQELSRKGGRLDLLFEKRGRHTIIELKKIRLNEAAIQQIEDYAEKFKDLYRLAAFHYLVGLPPVEPGYFKKRLRRASVRIRSLFLGVDIPLVFFFNPRLRRYVSEDAENAGGNCITFLL